MRRLVLPALSTVLMLAILLSLGTWQLHRLAWKRDLLTRIDAAETLPGVALDADPAPFAKVRVTGVFEPATALYGVELRGDVLGAHLVQLLVQPGRAPVVVDRGWVDAARSPPAAPAQPQTVEGYVRPPEHPGWFSAADDLGTRRFFTLDPARIGAALGAPAVAPFTLVALGGPAVPDPVRSLPRPPNDHLGYAITWYGFAATLLTIFVLYARKALHDRI